MRGLERGIEHAIGNIRTVAYVEIEAFIVWNLVKQMEQGVLAPAPVWSNLKTFPWQQFHGKIHGIIGGYPCQPFSVAGKQKGTEDPRHLWPFIKTGIQAVRPIWCFFENVPGHINIGFREVKSDLEQMGYRVEAGIYSAEEVGAPHQRKRLFILAIMANACYKSIWDSSGGFYSTPSSSSTELVYASGISTGNKGLRLDNRREICDQKRVGAKEGYRISRPSEMDNPQGFNSLRLPIGAKQEHSEFGKSGYELAHTNRERLQGWNSKELPECSGTCTARTSSACERWPARPGKEQCHWEEPRTESRMGFTINGYNYREDLLRMAGNGVVEQTAELAFKSLIKKFGIVI